MEDDNQQYEFGLDDLGDTNKTSNAFFAESRSPSPLPPPLAQRQQQQPYAHSQPSASSSTSNSSLFPYSTGHPQQALPQSQPFLQARPTSTPATQTHYSHAALPISQPVTLNPALLFNHQTNQARPQQQLQPQVIAPHQLSQPQPSSYQVNGITVTPTPSTSTATPAQNTASSASATPAPNGKTKRRTEFEVVVPQRREGSAPSSAKRKKTESTGDAARQPLSATKPKAGSSTATTTSAATSDQAPLQSILSVTPNTPQPPTQDQQEWNEIRKEMERTLHQATRSPHKTVMKMFKLLAPFVSEPPDATSRQGSREAFITDLRLPAEARLAILDVIKDETSDDFDVIFVVDPRATILLYEWTKDLALVAKGKYTGPESAEEIKKTSRSLLAVSPFFLSSGFVSSFPVCMPNLSTAFLHQPRVTTLIELRWQGPLYKNVSSSSSLTKRGEKIRKLLLPACIPFLSIAMREMIHQALWRTLVQVLTGSQACAADFESQDIQTSYC